MRPLLLAALFVLLSIHLHAQDATFLEPFTPSGGAIAAPGAAQSWTFSAFEGAVVSLLARGESNDFDPIITVSNSGGTVLAANDDFGYPETKDALLQAITLPRTDTYTATVTGYEDSTGTYSLTLFYGYADLQALLNFNRPVETWRTAGSGLTLDSSAGRLTLAASGISVGGYAVDDESARFSDFYAQVTIASLTSSNGGSVGLVLRHSEGQRYELLFNHRGQWRLERFDGDAMRTVRDWTNHPAITEDAETFTVGVLTHGGGFDVFYNNAYVGQAYDADASLAEGRIGLIARTADALNSQVTVEYDDLAVTVPLTRAMADIVPGQLIPGAQAITLLELERRRLIPVGGAVTLTVDESSGRLLNPGVNRVILARGTRFTDLVMSSEVEITAPQTGVVGCGLIFSHVSETEYALAFIDRSGGFGVSSRSGDAFLPGLFNVAPDIGQSSIHHLLVVYVGDTVHFYVDRNHRGTFRLPQQAGEVGVAVVNYEPIDTLCEFRNTWVWRAASP